MREAVASGCDPSSAVRQDATDEVAAPPPFGLFAEQYIASVEAGWRNPVHRQQWRSSIRDHASALSQVPVDQVTTEHVFSVLRPIWTSHPETASRLHGRIEKILDAARAHKLRPADASNPATWRGHLKMMLPAPSKLSRGHHPALSWKVAPAFMLELHKRPALAARCLEFTILTAARSGEALGATWNEIDLGAQLWSIPASRMKAGQPHVVPLSTRACDILRSLMSASIQPDGRVFQLNGAARSNMAMTMLLRRMDRKSITVHGFRSTFRDWAGDGTNYTRELIEQALAHTISNKAERAYRRENALDKRCLLMEDWANFLYGPWLETKVFVETLWRSTTIETERPSWCALEVSPTAVRHAVVHIDPPSALAIQISQQSHDHRFASELTFSRCSIAALVHINKVSAQS